MTNLVCTCGAVLDPEGTRCVCPECGQAWHLWSCVLDGPDGERRERRWLRPGESIGMAIAGWPIEDGHAWR